MVRLFVCAVLALAVGASLGLTAEKKVKGKKNKAVAGKIKQLDATTGALTIATRGKKGAEPQEVSFTVGEDAKVFVFVGEEKKELTGKDRFKDEQFREGARVRVVRDADGKVKEVQLGKRPRKNKGKKPADQP